MEMVAVAPAEAASASDDRASSCDAPSVIALLKVLVAGASASTMVLSPSRAAPSCWTPARAASRAADRSDRSTSAASPSAFPARRNAMPYSGPEAPPTLEMRVLPVRVKIAPGVFDAESSAPSTAVNPRERLVPWSASPIAASSCVRWSRLASITSAADTIQARKTSASMMAPTRRDSLDLASPPQGGRVHRRVPQPGELLVERAGRHREALHLQAGDVVAHQVPGDVCAVGLQVLPHLVEHEVELDQRRASHAVDHDEQVAVDGQVGADGVEREGGQLAGRGEGRPGPAGLAVDADAELHLSLAELEGGLAGRRHHARAEGHAEGTAPLVNLARHRGHGGQVGALLGQRPGDLFHEHRGPGAAAARG